MVLKGSVKSIAFRSRVKQKEGAKGDYAVNPLNSQQP